MNDCTEVCLLLLPGRAVTTFVVRIDCTRSVLTVRSGHFLEGLRAACALLSFSGLQRDDDQLDELLPWAGNV